ECYVQGHEYPEAAEAGWMIGDKILRINGKDVNSQRRQSGPALLATGPRVGAVRLSRGSRCLRSDLGPLNGYWGHRPPWGSEAPGGRHRATLEGRRVPERAWEPEV
ncbi:unnamed protein product, partial [Prorocentrum cordatum]